MSRTEKSMPLFGVLIATLTALSFATPVAAFWSSTSSASTTATTGTLNPPAGVTAVQPDPASATARISWSSPAAPSVTPTGYYVERIAGENLVPACGTTPDNPTATATCLDENLQPGRAYTWVVTAMHRSWTATSEPTAPVTVTAAPEVTVSDVSPAAGPTGGGTPITVTGTGFTAGTTLSVGGQTATQVIVVDAATITAVTPPGRAGAVDLIVTAPDGSTATLPGAFTYRPAPAIRRLTPREGPASGSTLVTITGRNFSADAQVLFGDTPASLVTLLDERTLTAVTPALEPGEVAVTVTTAGGTDTLRAAFTYRPAPITTAE